MAPRQAAPLRCRRLRRRRCAARPGLWRRLPDRVRAPPSPRLLDGAAAGLVHAGAHAASRRGAPPRAHVPHQPPLGPFLGLIVVGYLYRLDPAPERPLCDRRRRHRRLLGVPAGPALDRPLRPAGAPVGAEPGLHGAVHLISVWRPQFAVPGLARHHTHAAFFYLGEKTPAASRARHAARRSSPSSISRPAASNGLPTSPPKR